MGKGSDGIMVEASADFLDWRPIYTNEMPNIEFEFMDGEALFLPFRFYQIKPWP